MFPTESPGNHRLEVTTGQPQHMGSLSTEDSLFFSVFRHDSFTLHTACCLYNRCVSSVSGAHLPRDTTISGTSVSVAAGV